MGRWMETVTVYNAAEIGGATTCYSTAIVTNNLIPDYAALHIKLSATATLTITQQCSIDGQDWQEPTSATNVATYIATGIIRATGTYIPFVPAIAPYIRLKLDANPTVTTATIKLVSSGDVK